MYSIFAIQHAPAEMLLKHKAPAVYSQGDIYLFCETYEAITGNKYGHIIDIASTGLNHPYIEGSDGLTTKELNDTVDSLLDVLGEGEVQLSKKQGKYLYETRFKSTKAE